MVFVCFFFLFLFTKKQPDDLLMIHLLLLFVLKGTSRLAEMKVSAEQTTQIFICMCRHVARVAL